MLRTKAAGLIWGIAVAATVAYGVVEAQAQGTRPLPLTLSAEQRTALQELGTVDRLSIDAAGIPAHLEARIGTMRAAATAEADANAVLRSLRRVLRADGSESVAIRKQTRNATSGKRHYRMQQRINGLPVIGGEIILHVEDATGAVTSMDAQFLPGRGLARIPTVAAQTAVQIAAAQIDSAFVEQLTAPSLAYLRTASGKGYLVWTVRARYMDSQGKAHVDDLLIDATNGALIEKHPRLYDAHGVPNRQVFDFASQELVIAEGGATGDLAAQNAYDHSGATFNYFHNLFDRNSWDGVGGAMVSFVHGSQAGQNNANFDPATGFVFFGDGDGIDFGPWATRDVVAHEWTHGITQSEADLVYAGESGALNEAMSDIFGAAVEASITGVTGTTWQVGEEVVTPAVFGDALRYMNNPTADGNSRDFYPELQPTDDVHYGSGIGNLAFFLLANGGTHPRGRTATVVSGIGIDNAATIFYRALTDYLQSNHGYGQARNQTANAAIEHFGNGSAQFLQTCAAWDAVGVPNDGSVCPPPPQPPAPAMPAWISGSPLQSKTGFYSITWASSSTATHYVLERNVNSMEWGGAVTVSGTKKTYASQPSGEYLHRVKACNANACSDWMEGAFVLVCRGYCL